MIQKLFRSKIFAFVSVSFMTGIFYVFTISKKLTWANFGNDGGDFLAAILTGGIPHPTGYPTYTLAGILLQLAPFGDPYARVVLLSWLPAAIGAGFLTLLIIKILQDHYASFSIPIAILVGIAWGLMPFLWSQAVIVEVHGLQSLFLVLTIGWIWSLSKSEPGKSRTINLVLLSFAYGLAVGNHITILLFLPVIIISLLISTRKGFSCGMLLRQLIAFLIGLLVYLYLPIRAAQYPPINWGNPQTLQGFWWVISGNPYQNLVATTMLAQVFQRISALAGLLMQQFGIPGVILGVIGAIQFNHKQKQFPWFLVYLFFSFSFFAILYGTDDSITYLLAPFLVFAIWIALGMTIVIRWNWKKAPVGFILLGIYIVITVLNIPGTMREVNPRNQTQPADYAEYLLEQLPANTILLTSEDRDSFPLWYYHFGLGQREDIKVIVLPLTQFRWYQESLLHTYPGLVFPALISQISNQSQSWGEDVPKLNPDRPVCKSSINRLQGSSITVICSTGDNYNFVLSQ